MGDQDGSYKKIFSHPEMIEGLVQDFVKKIWVRDLDFSTLERHPDSYTTDDFRERRDDIIWRVRWKDKWCYIFLLIEFQSTVDPYMALRMMVYTGLLYQDLIDTQKVGRGEPLPPVFPLVLYNGESGWTARQEIAELIEPVPDELSAYCPRYRYFLVDEGRVPPDELEQADSLAAIMVRLERVEDPVAIRQIVQELVKRLRAPAYQNLRRAFAEWITRVLLRRIAPEENIPEVEDLTEVDAMLAETAVKWTEQWKNEGITEGIKRQGRNLIAKQLHLRFGKLPPFINEKIGQASPEEVDIWAERFVQAQTMEEVFEGLRHQSSKPVRGGDDLRAADTLTVAADRAGETERMEKSQSGVFQLLEKQLHKRFGGLPEDYRIKLQQASSEQLQTWGERLLDAQTLEEVFADQE